MNFENDEEILFELPEPPKNIPKPQSDWTAMNPSSMRFAVAALRKSSRLALARCGSLISTSKEAERLQDELDRVARQTKQDMTSTKVPRALVKDRRITALEDVTRSLEQMSKRLKVSRFMESYLEGVREDRKTAILELENRLQTAQAEGINLQGPAYPSKLEIATRVNRACPPSFTKNRALFTGESRSSDAPSVFLFNCRWLNE